MVRSGWSRAVPCDSVSGATGVRQLLDQQIAFAAPEDTEGETNLNSDPNAPIMCLQHISLLGSHRCGVLSTSRAFHDEVQS